MTKEQYMKITEPLRKNTRRTKQVRMLNSILTKVVFLAYPIYLAVLLLERDPWLARAIIVPLDSFLILTFVRYLINAPRPYEKFGVPPVLEKDTKGKSFPSRHVFSVFVIAVTVFCSYPAFGILLGIIGIGIAVIRVAGGVHEPKDVVVGAFVGILSGVIGYYL